MKTIHLCILIMFIPLIGGCTEQERSDTKIPAESGLHVETIQTGFPPTITHWYLQDTIYPTLLDIRRTFNEIDLEVKDVKTALDVAGRKAPISGNVDIRRTLEEIDLKLRDIRTSLLFSDPQLYIEEIDSKIRDVRTALDNTNRRVQISGDIVQIVTYLRPKLNIELDPNVLCSDNKIKMTFNITNLGEHSVLIGEPQLTLSKKYIRGKDATAGLLTPDANNKFEWESCGFYAAPGQTIKKVAHIDIRQNELEGRPRYYSLCIDAETAPEIVNVLSGLLLDSIETYKLYNISCASFTFDGEIDPSAFHDPE